MTTPVPESFTRQLRARLAAPSMLAPSAVDRVLSLAFRAATDEGASAFFGDAPGAYSVDADGVATVRVEGPLAQRAWSCWMFGGDGYDAIESRVRAALDDPRSRSLVIEYDSPGGEVAGCGVCADAIRSAADASGKPVISYVGELAASAAYWLASAADKIVTPPSGMLGSIGVIATRIEDTTSGASGRKVHLITSGARKADGHPTVPLSEEELAATQAKIDALADVFAGAVAERRGMTLAQVRGLEADVFVGADAVTRGLADSVGNLSSAVAMARELATTRRSKQAMKAVNKALNLAEDSAEPIAVAAIEGLKAQADHAKKLEAQIAKIESERAAREAAEAAADHQRALAEGDAKGVFTPAVRALYASRSAEEIRAFVSVAPRVIAAQETGKPGPKPAAGVEAGSKPFEQMSPMERHALHQSNPEAYRALRADAEKRGAL
jgi:signal peptide peptidase SppA